jgi:hypothetical protein
MGILRRYNKTAVAARFRPSAPRGSVGAVQVVMTLSGGRRGVKLEAKRIEPAFDPASEQAS